MLEQWRRQGFELALCAELQQRVERRPEGVECQGRPGVGGTELLQHQRAGQRTQARAAVAFRQLEPSEADAAEGIAHAGVYVARVLRLALAWAQVVLGELTRGLAHPSERVVELEVDHRRAGMTLSRMSSM